jgi:hypothetical protein
VAIYLLIFMIYDLGAFVLVAAERVRDAQGPKACEAPSVSEARSKPDASREAGEAARPNDDIIP